MKIDSEVINIRQDKHSYQINVRLSKADIDDLLVLIKQQKFMSVSDAVRYATRKFINELKVSQT